MEAAVNWKHQEDVYNDFNAQYLLPHQGSTAGPKLAVSDVNGDGLDDFFVCGAKGQAGALFVQQANGQFRQQSNSSFEADKESEDTDAVFFDANGDTHPDLLVVSGGHVFHKDNPLLADRLYLNDGKGNFNKTTGALPAVLLNKTCAATGDLDGDGDVDVFLGVGTEPGAFGALQRSILLLNDGKGKFSAAPDGMLDLDLPGFITDALVADLNGDGMPELAVAGEWMPVTIFWNKKGAFERKTLEGSGLWQCLSLQDVNADGRPDLMAGNWGYNSKLKADKTRPIKLYVNDFDNNSQLDPILAYTKNGAEYSFLGRDELEKVLPFVKKKFNSFASFAGKSTGEVFDLKKAGLSTFTVNVTASSVFLNQAAEEFTRSDLPMNCQLSPVFSCVPLGQKGAFLTGGNFFGVRPYEGRYDAAALTAFQFGQPAGQVLSIQGEVRDMAWIRMKGRQVLVVARNNGALQFYTSI
jgi:hypothetical protein